MRSTQKLGAHFSPINHSLPTKPHHDLLQLLLRKLQLGTPQKSLSYSSDLFQCSLLYKREPWRCLLLAQQMSRWHLAHGQLSRELQWTNQLPVTKLWAQQLWKFLLPFHCLLWAQTLPRNQFSSCCFLHLQLLPPNILQTSELHVQQLWVPESPYLWMPSLGLDALWSSATWFCVQQPQTSASFLWWMPTSDPCIQLLSSILLCTWRPVASLFLLTIVLRIKDKVRSLGTFASFLVVTILSYF